MFTTPFSSFDVLPNDFTKCTVDGTDYTAHIELDPDTCPDEFEGYPEERFESWGRGDWYFVGVVIRAERGGVLLGDNLASLWGIESDSSPEYFLDIANEARKRIALAMA